MSIKIGLQNERVVIRYTDDAIEQYRADGDVEAIDGSTSSTITVRLTSNDAILIADYEYDDFLDLNGSQHGASRSIVKTKLNDLVFNGALYPRGSSILISNQLSQTLSKGAAVSISSYNSSLDLPYCGLASNNVSSMMPAIGLTKASIDSANEGEVVTKGILDKIDTSSYTSGDVLYVGEAGALTNTKPTGSTAVLQRIAVVVRSHATLGSVYVDVQDVSHLLRDNTPQLGGDLDVNGNKITSASNGDIVIDPHGTGKILLQADEIRTRGNGSVGVGIIKLYEGDILADDNFVALQAPVSLASDLTFTLPAADGNNGEFLQTNGSGNLSWSAFPMLPIANVSGRYTWSSTDDKERVYTGSSVYGPYNYYSHSIEPLVSAIREYTGNEVVGTTTASINGYKLFTHGIKNSYSGKKVRVDYSFRIYYSGSAPTTGTPFGFSIWSGNAGGSGSVSNVTVTYRGESQDHTMVAPQMGGTTAHHHGSFTTSSVIDQDYILVLAEHRGTTGLNGTTYMVANFNVYLTD